MKKNAVLVITMIIVLTLGLLILTGCGEKKEENNITNDVQSFQKNESTNNTTNNVVNDVTTLNTKKFEYTYTDGTLIQVVDEEGKPKQTDFVIDGIILAGNHHEYRTDDATMGNLEFLVKDGYKKGGINSEFYLGEYIEFYIDTRYTGSNDDVKIMVAPHKTVEEYEIMSLYNMSEIAINNGGFVLEYKTPQEDMYKYVGEGYVHQDYPEGKYDILITYKGKLAYYLTINEIKEN